MNQKQSSKTTLKEGTTITPPENIFQIPNPILQTSPEDEKRIRSYYSEQQRLRNQDKHVEAVEKSLHFISTCKQTASSQAVMLSSLGQTLVMLGKHGASLFESTYGREIPVTAEQMLRHAISLTPESVLYQNNYALQLLAVGKLKEGWRYSRERHNPRRIKGVVTGVDAMPFPRWAGESLKDKSIFISAEQGIGDEIQLARFIPLLKEKAGAKHVLLMVKAPIVPLIRMLPGIDKIVSFELNIKLPVCDYWTYPLELPRFFDINTPEDIPNTPYINPEPKYLEKWQAILEQKIADTKRPTGNLRVGLAWKGNPDHGNDQLRSIHKFNILSPLWEIPDVSFFSLLKINDDDNGIKEANELKELSKSQPICVLSDEIEDMADTAAIIEQLDLVISVDTSIAHLAGAMGKPCWLMLPAWGIDWRWGLEGEQTAWYPSMRLFWQTLGINDDPKAWTDVIQRIKKSLANAQPKLIAQRDQPVKRTAPATTLAKLVDMDLIRMPKDENKDSKTDKDSDDNEAPSKHQPPDRRKSSFEAVQMAPVNPNPSPETLEEIKTARQNNRALYEQGKMLDFINAQIPMLVNYAQPAISKAQDIVLLASALNILGSHIDALFLMEKAEELLPENLEIRENLGIILNKAGFSKEASEKLRQIPDDIKNKKFNVLDALANAESRSNQIEQAILHGQQSLELKDQIYCQEFQGKAFALPLPTRPVFNPDKPKRNIISFSLWGNNIRYTQSAVENVTAAQHVFPSWTCRFYCDESVPNKTLNELKEKGAQVYMMPEAMLYEGLNWRFLVSSDPDIDFFLVRDADAVVNVKERVAVDEWLDSDKYFHLIRDYYTHTDLMLAGLWGGVANILPDMNSMLIQYTSTIHAQKYGTMVSRTLDQSFLRHCVWPLIKPYTMTHDDYFGVLGAQPFPPFGSLPLENHIGQSAIRAPRTSPPIPYPPRPKNYPPRVTAREPKDSGELAKKPIGDK